MVTNLLSLPPELLLQILSLVGWDRTYYTPKERQGDLAAFSLIHSRLRHLSQALLYSSPFVRNAGRAFLLERSLSTTGAPLATLLLSLSCLSNKSEDRGHPGSITSILSRATSINALALGAMLFVHEEASDKLREVIKEMSGMKKFSFGFATPKHPLKPPEILDLLTSWKGLEDLSLDTVVLHHTIPPQLTSTQLPPTYVLRKLSLYRVGIQGSTSLSTLLGSSSSTFSTSIRELSLHEVTFEDDPSSLSPPPSSLLLSPTSLSSLTHLTLRDVDFESSLTRQPFNPCRLDALHLRSCTSLQSLSLGDHHAADLTTLVFDRLHLPPNLRKLELFGRALFRQVRLEEALGDWGEAKDLEEVVVYGPMKSSGDVQRCGRIAKDRGVNFSVKFLH